MSALPLLEVTKTHKINQKFQLLLDGKVQTVQFHQIHRVQRQMNPRHSRLYQQDL